MDLEERVREIVRDAIETALAQQQQPDDDPWLTYEQAAEYIGLARSTIWDLVNDGDLPRHGPRRTRLLFRRSDLDRYVESRGRRS
jgi:excisionase family DNA binding protein